MSWKKKKKKSLSKYNTISIINKLLANNTLSKSTLNNIDNISLEDLIAI